jgi:hypothetical protein
MPAGWWCSTGHAGRHGQTRHARKNHGVLRAPPVIAFLLRGEVEIGVSDGSTQIFRPGDARLMEDTSGRGHTHQDLSPVIQAVVVLKD